MDHGCLRPRPHWSLFMQVMSQPSLLEPEECKRPAESIESIKDRFAGPLEGLLGVSSFVQPIVGGVVLSSIFGRVPLSMKPTGANHRDRRPWR